MDGRGCLPRGDPRSGSGRLGQPFWAWRSRGLRACARPTDGAASRTLRGYPSFGCQERAPSIVTDSRYVSLGFHRLSLLASAPFASRQDLWEAAIHLGGGRGVRAVWVPAHRPAPQPPLLTLADWRGNSRADALATQALASAQPPEALLAAALQADAEYVVAVRVGTAVLEAELAWAHLGIESGPTRFPRKRPRVRFQARPARPASAIPVPVGPVLLQHLPTRALRVSTLWRSSAARQGPSLSTGLPAVGRPHHVPNGAIWLTPRVEGGLRPWLLRRVLHGRGSTATCRLRARALSFACDVASVPLPRGRRSGAAGCASPGASGRRVKLRLWIGMPSWLCNLVGPQAHLELRLLFWIRFGATQVRNRAR